jgi:aspartate carbamoyltransferase catalytic subunit
MTTRFQHRHLLDIERLSTADIDAILNLTEGYADQNRADNRKINKLTGKTVVNLFFEPSTRTRTSFELAAKRLGADVVNIPVEHSSTKKGESFLDTVQTLDAMQIDALVIRHNEDGVPQFVAPHLRTAVINAGDGKHEHPTQALTDAYTIRAHKKKLQGLTVAICGDIAHSRVARSNMYLLTKFGVKVRLIAPSYFLTPKDSVEGVEVFEDMKEGLKDVDVIMMLRIQHERMAQGEFAVSLKDYHQRYGLDHKKLAVAKPDVIVMHPGPVNRDVEITSSLADDPKFSVIHEQVEYGVAIKMAVLDLLLTK